MASKPALLIVEEDAAARSLFRGRLQRAGCRVFVASTPAAAYRSLRARPEIRLMLVDVKARTASSSLKLASRAKDVRPGLRLLFTTDLATIFRRFEPGAAPAAEDPVALLARLIDTLMGA